MPWQADAVRLALLAKYGGLWIDASTICFRPFDDFIYGPVASDTRPEDLAAFYFSAWGVRMHESKEGVSYARLRPSKKAFGSMMFIDFGRCASTFCIVFPPCCSF